ncbi:MAG: glycerol-3-phosphate dehydrogenase, partial [Bacteroidota bacterium]
MIAEGYYATKSMFELSNTLKIDMPIARAVYNVIYNNQPALNEIKQLSEKLI